MKCSAGNSRGAPVAEQREAWNTWACVEHKALPIRTTGTYIRLGAHGPAWSTKLYHQNHCHIH